MSDTEFTPKFSGGNRQTDFGSSEGSSYDSEMEAKIYESTRMSEETAAKGPETGRKRTGYPAVVGNHRQRQVNTGRVGRSPDRGCMELQHIGIRLPERVSSQREEIQRGKFERKFTRLQKVGQLIGKWSAIRVKVGNALELMENTDPVWNSVDRGRQMPKLTMKH